MTVPSLHYFYDLLFIGFQLADTDNQTFSEIMNQSSWPYASLQHHSTQETPVAFQLPVCCFSGLNWLCQTCRNAPAGSLQVLPNPTNVLGQTWCFSYAAPEAALAVLQLCHGLKPGWQPWGEPAPLKATRAFPCIPSSRSLLLSTV